MWYSAELDIQHLQHDIRTLNQEKKDLKSRLDKAEDRLAKIEEYLSFNLNDTLSALRSNSVIHGYAPFER